mgnify:CR=1 FL=1
MASIVKKNRYSVVYTYTDENGTSHEVWYGDQETLEIWMKWLQEGGNREFSIWRLGE